MTYECLVIRWKFDQFCILKFLLKSFCLTSNIKHSTQYFITRWNTSNFVKNIPLRVVFLTLFSVFHLVKWGVWILEIRSENGCGKLPFLVWIRVRIWRIGRHTPTKNSQEYRPGRIALFSVFGCRTTHRDEGLIYTHLVTLNTLRSRTHLSTLMPSFKLAYLSSIISTNPDHTTCCKQIRNKKLLKNTEKRSTIFLTCPNMKM